MAAAKENDTHENMKKIHYANVYDQNGQRAKKQRWQEPLHLLPMQIETICQSPQMRVPQNSSCRWKIEDGGWEPSFK